MGGTYQGGSYGGAGSDYAQDNSSNFSSLMEAINSGFESQNAGLMGILEYMADSQTTQQIQNSELAQGISNSQSDLLKTIAEMTKQTTSQTIGDHDHNYPDPNYNNSTVGVRQYLENLGYAVGWDQATGDILIDGKRYSGTAYQNVNDRLQATTQQMQNLVNQVGSTSTNQKINWDQTVGVRQYLESRGYSVGWNADTRQILVNGKSYGSAQFKNVNDQLQGTIRQIYNVFGIM